MAQDTTEAIAIDEESPLIIDAEHTGTSNFILDLIDLQSGSESNLINEIGNFDGRVIEPVNAGKYNFNITYDQSYSLNPVGFNEDEILEPPLSVSGSDYGVIPVELDDPVRLKLSAVTDSNVIVTLKNLLGQNVDILINEIAPGDVATTVTTQGTGIFYIETKDDWDVSLNPL